MKKFALLIGAIFLSTKLWATPVGNTSAPALIEEGLFASSENWVSFRSGYEGDFVADGRMKQYDQGTGRIDTYQQHTNSGTVTMNFHNRLDIYGVFGSSKTKADWRFENGAAGTTTRIKVETKHNLLWGIGSRAILCEWWNASLGLGGRYSSCHYRSASLTSNGASQPTAGSHFKWKEWQINLDISYKIHFFTPYIGTKYSHARTSLTGFAVPISSSLARSNSFKNRDPVGLYLGCTISNGKYFMLNLEGRLIDEEAVTVSCDFRF